MNSPIKFWTKIMHFCRDFISEGWNVSEVSCPRKEFWVRNFVPQEEISCRGRYSLSQEETSCWTMIFPFTGKKFLLREKVSWHKKKFPVTGRHFLSRKNFHRKRQNFKPQKEICFYKKKFPGTRQNFLLQEVIFCQRKKWLGLGIVIVIIYTPTLC